LREEFAYLMEKGNKYEQEKLQDLYRLIQEQAYASSTQLRNELEDQLASLRQSLAERSQRQITGLTIIQRASWAYIALGGVFAFLGFSSTGVLEALRQPSQHLPELIGFMGVAMAFIGALFMFLDFYRRGVRDRDRQAERHFWG
jgi:hypothetical protein